MIPVQCPAGRVFQYRVGSGRVGVSKYTIGYFRVSFLLSGISGYVGYLRVFTGIYGYIGYHLFFGGSEQNIKV